MGECWGGKYTVTVRLVRSAALSMVCTWVVPRSSSSGCEGVFGRSVGAAEPVGHGSALAAEQTARIVERPEAVTDHGLAQALDAHAQGPQVAAAVDVAAVAGAVAFAVVAVAFGDAPHRQLDDRAGQHAGGIATADKCQLVAVGPAAGRVGVEPRGEKLRRRVSPDPAHALTWRQAGRVGPLAAEFAVATVDLRASLCQRRQADATAGLVVYGAVHRGQHEIAEMLGDHGAELLGSTAQQAHLVGALREHHPGARLTGAMRTGGQFAGNRQHLGTAVDAERPGRTQSYWAIGLLQVGRSGQQLDEQRCFRGLSHLDPREQVGDFAVRLMRAGLSRIVRGDAVAVHAAPRPAVLLPIAQNPPAVAHGLRGEATVGARDAADL